MRRICIPFLAIVLTALIVAAMQFMHMPEVQVQADTTEVESPYYSQLTDKIDALANSNWDTLLLMSIEADLASKKKLNLIPSDIAESLHSRLYGEYIRVLTNAATSAIDSAYTIDSIASVYAEISRIHEMNNYTSATEEIYVICNKLITFSNLMQQIDSFIQNEKFYEDKNIDLLIQLTNANEDFSIKNCPMIAINVPQQIDNLNKFEEFDDAFMKAYYSGNLARCPTLIEIFVNAFDYPNKYLYYLINYTNCYPD